MTENASFPTLADAEELYEKAKKCSTLAAITALLGVVRDKIRDYLAVSSAEHSNPAIYKVLRDTVRLLETRDQDATQGRGIGFKFTKRKLPAASGMESVSKCSNITGSSSEEESVKAKGDREGSIDANSGRIRISGLIGEVIVRNNDELKEVGIVNIKKLDHCRVVLLGTVDTTYITQVKDSIIWIGISRGSVILDSLTDSTVIVCCSQLRISNSNHNTFLIETVTTPIIERSSNILFANNHVVYPGFNKALEESRLQTARLSRHTVIKDFSWHHDTPSPNWSIVASKPAMTLSLKEALPGPGNVNGNKHTFSEDEWHAFLNLKHQRC